MIARAIPDEKTPKNFFLLHPGKSLRNEFTDE